MNPAIQESKKIQRLMHLSRCRLELLTVLHQKNKLRNYAMLVELLTDILVSTETLATRIRSSKKYTPQEQTHYNYILKANRRFSLLFRDCYKGFQ